MIRFTVNELEELEIQYKDDETILKLIACGHDAIEFPNELARFNLERARFKNEIEDISDEKNKWMKIAIQKIDEVNNLKKEIIKLEEKLMEENRYKSSEQLKKGGGMTKKQYQVLEFIEDFISQHGYSPSYEEIREGLGLKSKSSVYAIVKKLVKIGRISSREKESRSIEIIR